jgi:broad specificity phosphatase PhoE
MADMVNTLVFLRHAKTKKDTTIPIERWVLTEDGEKAAQELANSGTFDYVDIVISSDEDKAYLTIKPIADRLKKRIIRIPELSEIKRPNSEKLPTKEYEELKTKIFDDLNYTEQGWETANHALRRFKGAVIKIDKRYKDKKILICAHGTVISLYFASLQGKLNDLFSRWKELEFSNYGIVQAGRVIKDIV